MGIEKWKEAKRAFFLDREQWRQQINHDPRLSKSELRVVLELSFCLNADPDHPSFGKAFPSIELLAKRLKLSNRTIVAACIQLEMFGHVRIERGGGRGNSNRYVPIIQSAGS